MKYLQKYLRMETSQVKVLFDWSTTRTNPEMPWNRPDSNSSQNNHLTKIERQSFEIGKKSISTTRDRSYWFSASFCSRNLYI